MKWPTLRSTTNPTTRHRRQPPRRKEMAPTLPCLQWRPRSVDHCSASPGSGRGWGNNTWVLYYNGWGLHTVGAFSVIPGMGMGGWTQAPVNADTAFLTEHSHDSSPAPSVPPVPVKHVGNSDGFIQDKHFILYLRMEHNFVTSLGHLIWLKEGLEFTCDGCHFHLLFPAHQCCEKKTRT